MSSSSVRRVSTPDSPQQIDQSVSSLPVTSLSVINTQEGNKEHHNVPIKGRLFARKPIRRRTTKREARHLRNGVSSDSETKPFNNSSSDDDDYIKMSSLNPKMTFDPRASGYYLKILPSDSGGLDRRALSEEPMTHNDNSDSESETDPSYLQILSSDDLLSPDSPDYIAMSLWESNSLVMTNEDNSSMERDVPSNWIAGIEVRYYNT